LRALKSYLQNYVQGRCLEKNARAMGKSLIPQAFDVLPLFASDHENTA
jgi:hypothetical protein